MALNIGEGLGALGRGLIATAKPYIDAELSQQKAAEEAKLRVSQERDLLAVRNEVEQARQARIAEVVKSATGRIADPTHPEGERDRTPYERAMAGAEALTGQGLLTEAAMLKKEANDIRDDERTKEDLAMRRTLTA